MKQLSTIGVAAIALATMIRTTCASDIDPPPCDDCTNGPLPVYEAEFSPDSELIRIVQITAGGWGIWTNSYWVYNTNGNFIPGPGGWTGNTDAMTNRPWTYTLGVINTTNSGYYAITYSTNLTTWSELGYFIGSSNETAVNVNIYDPTGSPGFWRVKQRPELVVWSQTPVWTGGKTNTPGCPGGYIGYANYIKPAVDGWGWSPDTNSPAHFATDILANYNPITYLGYYLDSDCSVGGVVVSPTYSPVYRFTVYFKANFPTNTPYPLLLTGFNQ